MRYDLLSHMRPELARQIEGTTDSEWLYTLILSQVADPTAPADPDELADATMRAYKIVREVRARHGLERQSAVNLVLSDGRCLVATRFAYDYGWYHDSWTFAGASGPTTSPRCGSRRAPATPATTASGASAPGAPSHPS